MDHTLGFLLYSLNNLPEYNRLQLIKLIHLPITQLGIKSVAEGPQLLHRGSEIRNCHLGPYSKGEDEVLEMRCLYMSTTVAAAITSLVSAVGTTSSVVSCIQGISSSAVFMSSSDVSST
jgi:hypothetical protein